MELDELKTHLQQKMNEEQPSISDDALLRLLKNKTTSTIDKLKRSLRLEILFTILFTIAFLYVAIFNKHQGLRIYFGIFNVLCIGFLLLLIYLHKKITVLGNTDLPIKQNLIAIHSIIKEFCKRYLQFTIGLIPVCMIISAYLGYTDAKNGDHYEQFTLLNSLLDTRGRFIIFIIVYTLLLIVVVYFLSKWYIKKLYGRYLLQLQECIDELGEA
jgi:Ca2+/Na+ antiporter